MNIFTTALSNPHTSGSAIAFGAVKMLSSIAKVWWPEYRHKIELTADALETFAIIYFGVAAGDAAKSVTKQEADTTFMRKPGAPPATTTKP